MKKIEKFAFITCPFVFGLVLVIIGMFAMKHRPDLPHGIIMICSGLICVCLFAISSLLTKIIENRNN